MVSSSLALLYFLLGFHGGRQGSGPDRGQSPVEWGDIPSVRPSVRTSPPLGHPARPEAQPARPEAQPARSEAQPASQSSLRQMNKRTDEWNISPFYRTLSPIGAAALLPPMKTAKVTDQQTDQPTV